MKNNLYARKILTIVKDLFPSETLEVDTDFYWDLHFTEDDIVEILTMIEKQLSVKIDINLSNYIPSDWSVTSLISVFSRKLAIKWYKKNYSRLDINQVTDKITLMH